MNLQETIQAEKQRVQEALDRVCDPGATMQITLEDGGSLRFEVDGFVVLRALPQVDAQGEVKQWRYDLLFKEVGYDQGMQYAHFISNARVAEDGRHWAVLIDEHGNMYTANVIEPDIDPEVKAVFDRWCAQKAAEREKFERMDQQLVEEYTRMAEAGDE